MRESPRGVIIGETSCADFRISRTPRKYGGKLEFFLRHNIITDDPPRNAGKPELFAPCEIVLLTLVILARGV